MKSSYPLLLQTVLFISCMLMCSKTVHATQDDILFFNKPAQNWHEANLLGNGRLGAIVFGGISQDSIQTNDDTFWAGGPRRLQNNEAITYLPQIRKLIENNQNQEAEKLINSKIVGPIFHSYLPLADIHLNYIYPDVKEAVNYRRILNMDKGTLTVSYSKGGVDYQRVYFISYPDQALIMKFTASKPVLHTQMELSSKVKSKSYVKDNCLYIDGQAPAMAYPHYYEGDKEPIYKKDEGMLFQAQLFIKECNGKITTTAGKLQVESAGKLTLAYVAATSFNGFENDPVKNGKNQKMLCENYKQKVLKKKYDLIYKDHTNDFSSLYSRVKIDLGHSAADTLPLDERIRKYQKDTDPDLTAQYFRLGRYLLISSSRPGSQPANLQGIWCNELVAAWSCNYTTNCNIEITYWPAEITNLSECHEPLMKLISELTTDGSRTARSLYGVNGWTVHHNIDLWRTTWPVGNSGQWGIYQSAPGWLCQHIWEHYLYTQDKDFLRKYYPVMEGASRFYVENLQECKEGYLVTNPTVSFENTYIKPDGSHGWACKGSSQDMQVIGTLFDNTIKAMKILSIQSPMEEKISAASKRLAPLKINPENGELMEWMDNWKDEHMDGQIGQGWGAIASNLITLRKTPELAKAFRKTLEAGHPSLKQNCGSWTGSFALGWWNRQEEADSAQQVIDRHFKQALYPNLSSKFHNFFQMDGNMGMTAGIAEMLLQSHDDEINLLPALPKKYSNGYVKGLKARGNYEVSISWENSQLTSAKIKAVYAGSVKVRYKEKAKTVTFNKGEEKKIAF
ncbi:MAG: glycoside hydrolase family 95 protein [Parabacteroides sp.]|nr:glycoside hydrolase family 95 protein [Parabacteroides sp.]